MIKLLATDKNENHYTSSTKTKKHPSIISPKTHCDTPSYHYENKEKIAHA